MFLTYPPYMVYLPLPTYRTYLPTYLHMFLTYLLYLATNVPSYLNYPPTYLPTSCMPGCVGHFSPHLSVLTLLPKVMSRILAPPLCLGDCCRPAGLPPQPSSSVSY